MSKKEKLPNILEKVRVLDAFKEPDHIHFTLREKAALATQILKRSKPIGKSTIGDWIKNEAEYRRQAAGVYDGKSNKKPKNLRRSEVYDFGEEFCDILTDYSSHTNIVARCHAD